MTAELHVHGIRHHDHPLRFWVPSETRYGLEHLVDISAYRQNGRCACEHFVYRCEPELRRGALPSPLLRCHHIEKARDFFISEMLDKIRPHLCDQDEGEGF